MSDSPLGKERWERIKERIVERYLDMVNDVIDLLLADKDTPPFADKKTPVDVMAQLIAWRDAQDPRYWQSTQAQSALRQLQAQYGMGVPGIGERTPPQPATPSAEQASFENVLSTGAAPMVLGGY